MTVPDTRPRTTFVTFSPPDIATAQAIGDADFDGVVFEMEHNPYDIRQLRDCMQYMLDRRQIARSGSIAPAVTPMVRIPANGGEMNQFLAKQVLLAGAVLLVALVPAIEEFNVASLTFMLLALGIGLLLTTNRDRNRLGERAAALRDLYLVGPFRFFRDAMPGLGGHSRGQCRSRCCGGRDEALLAVGRDGADLGEAMALGVRTWGNDPHGSTVLLMGCYQLRGEISRRVADSAPTIELGLVRSKASVSSTRSVSASDSGVGEPISASRLAQARRSSIHGSSTSRWVCTSRMRAVSSARST